MKKSEFRFNKKRKHPAYIFRKLKNKYHCILITHSSRSNNKRNIKLYSNPSPNDKKNAYIIPKVYKDDILSFNKKTYQNWSFHKFDKPIIKKIKKYKK